MTAVFHAAQSLHRGVPAGEGEGFSTVNWTDTRDLRTQLQRSWDRGELLAGMVSGEPTFPRRLMLKGPTSAQLAEQFDQVRAWIAELRAVPHYRVEMRDLRHRVLGANQVPKAVWVDRLEDALSVLNKHRQAALFSNLVESARQRQPLLLEWIVRRPLKVLELADAWERLLDVVDWIDRHPRPGIYLRQVDIPGVQQIHRSAHRGVLMQWLDLILQSDAVDAGVTGIAGFARRYGFCDRPHESGCACSIRHMRCGRARGRGYNTGRSELCPSGTRSRTRLHYRK